MQSKQPLSCLEMLLLVLNPTFDTNSETMVIAEVGCCGARRARRWTLSNKALQK
jgi:hypothetical protein